MTSFDTRAHFGAIRGELGHDEYLLWWGRPFAELETQAQRVVETVIATFVLCGFGLFLSFGLAGTFQDLPMLIFLTPPIVLPLAVILRKSLSHRRHREATLYALTNERVLRATGRESVRIDSIRFSDMTSVGIDGLGAAGTIWCTLPQHSRASRRKATRHAIIRDIARPREVYALITSIRPELIDQHTDASVTLTCRDALADRRK